MFVKTLKKQEARAKMVSGIKMVAEAVKITIGPGGRNVALIDVNGHVEMTNDGKRVADSFNKLKDEFENGGASLAREISDKTNDDGGDGRSTSILLYENMVDQGMQSLEVGISVTELRDGMMKARDAAVEVLQDMTVKEVTTDDIKKVATVSSESSEIGGVIADLIEKIGEDAVITTEESNSIGIESEVTQGLEIDKGYVSPYMITNGDKMTSEYENVHVLVTDKKISLFSEILPVLQILQKIKVNKLVIIAEDIADNALGGIIVNKLQGSFHILGIKNPGYGDKKKEILGDIASVLGAKVVAGDIGSKLEDVKMDDLGFARNITSTKEKTVIVGNGETGDMIKERVAQLKAQRETMEQKYQIEMMDERIAKLSGGVGVIRVGAITEKNMNYLRAKVSDAVASARAAKAEGIVAGGGSTLVRIAQVLESRIDETLLTDDERLGYKIFIKALYSPIKQIMKNCGDESDQIVIGKIKEGKTNSGYDGKKKMFVENMFDAGVMDAAKVVRLSLIHSATDAAMFLTTDFAVAEQAEQK